MGFGPFSKYYINISGEIAGLLNGRIVKDHRVVGRVLPVSLRAVREEFPRLVEGLRPSLILGLGLAPRAGKVLLELAFHNTAFFEEADVDGHRAWLEPLAEDGPGVVETRLPVRRVMEECGKDRGLPLRPSVSAGTYLCNAVGYLVSLSSSRLDVPGGFLHLPPHTDLAMRLGLSNHQPLRLIAETVECVLEASLEG